MDDDFFDDDFDDDFEPQKSFSDILFELERNGEILKQWEMGAPNDNATETKTNENEKRNIIQ
ncbi:MAG TPA: hypothetical protein PLH60_08635 [Proteiniphilum sp.]|nr:hypothetical protein [Proteiniphilum sp.]HPJ50972.1 hypothetical protein [Proteiniphilum sp.]HPR20608.1 hypothetical protein [Proteiniphilum sp.]